jgi:hypothetical protein
MFIKHVNLLWCSVLRQNLLLEVDSDVQEVDTTSILHTFGDLLVHRASLTRIFIVEYMSILHHSTSTDDLFNIHRSKNLFKFLFFLNRVSSKRICK